jgi:hypothetical protein
MLGFDGKIEEGGWTIKPPAAGQKLSQPEPLFAKLDQDVVKEETENLLASQKERLGNS